MPLILDLPKLVMLFPLRKVLVSPCSGAQAKGDASLEDLPGHPFQRRPWKFWSGPMAKSPKEIEVRYGEIIGKYAKIIEKS